MQERLLFEYAVVRVVPRVEREEFLNVGIILFCAQAKFLESIFCLNEERLLCFSANTNLNTVKENLDSFQKISKGLKDSGPIGQYDAAARFRWLTATRSTIIQCSKVHPGFTSDPIRTLEKLQLELVL